MSKGEFVHDFDFENLHPNESEKNGTVHVQYVYVYSFLKHTHTMLRDAIKKLTDIITFLSLKSL
jgi:hypothetical protein